MMYPYSKATYAKPFFSRFYYTLGKDIVGTRKKPHMNVIYAILANLGIEPLDKDKYGTPLFKYSDLETLQPHRISDAFHKWQEDMEKQDSKTKEQYNLDNSRVVRMPGYKVTKKMRDREEMEKASDELLRKQEVYFDDDYDDELYESLFSKKLYLTEKQLDYIHTNLLLEGDSRLKAVDRIIDAEFKGILNPDNVVSGPNYYVNGNPQTTWRQYILYSLRHTFGLMDNKDVQYLPLVAKLAFSDEVGFQKRNDNGRQLQLLQRIISILKTDNNLFLQLNQQRNALTFSDVYNQLKPQIEEIERIDNEGGNNIQERNDYDIIEVPDFETAKYYGDYSCSNSKLCYTQSEQTWEGYKGTKGENRVYVCLKHGWENIPEQPGPGNPYDEYGTSMIFVFINPDGDIVTSNCRWNHKNIGKYDGTVDDAFSKTRLAQTVGRNFDATFKPYDANTLRKKGIRTIADAIKMLEQGVEPIYIFDYVKKGKDGKRMVSLNLKYNILLPNNKLFYPIKEWADYIDIDTVTGYFIIFKDGKYNMLKSDNTYLLEKPVDFIGCFKKESLTCVIEDKDKGYNFVNINGEIISPEYFSYVQDFKHGFALVYRRVDKTIPEQLVNFINLKGELLVPNEWFDSATNFYKMDNNMFLSLVSDYVNDKEYWLDQNGRKYSYETFENCKCVDVDDEEPEPLDENARKNIYLTEEQIRYIKSKLVNESFNYVDPTKVLLVKRYLDDNFVRASMPIIGDNGYPTTMELVGLKGTDGQVARNLSGKQLFYLLQDKFQGIYGDKYKRDSFLKQVMIDWFNKKITREGLLSTNKY